VTRSPLVARGNAGDVSALDGTWRVERERGVLPPFGVGKRIRGGTGWTTIAGVPAAPFRVAGYALVYRGWPVRDELEPQANGRWRGRGFVLGREFCRFRLVPVERTQPRGTGQPSN
jgi:hypothetical protein